MQSKTYLLTLFILCLFPTAIIGNSAPKKVRTGRLLNSLRNLDWQEQVLKCQLDESGQYLSVLSAGEKTISYSDKFELIHLSIFQAARGRLINKLAISEKKKRSLAFRQVVPLPPTTAFSPALKGVALCRQDDKNKFAEIEFWSLSQKKMVNYLKTSLNTCHVTFRFLPETQKLSVLHRPDGRMMIWNLNTGISEQLPQTVLSSRCLAISPDFSTAYCLDNDANPTAFDMTSGNSRWIMQFPEKMSVSFWEKWGKRIFTAIGRPLPNFLHNILMEKPIFFATSPDGKSISTYYSQKRKEKKKKEERDQLKGLFFQHNASDGSYLRHHKISKPIQSNLINISYDSVGQRLIAEDFNPERKNYISLMTLTPESGHVQRTGIDCTGSWAYWPKAGGVLSCGYCNEKNEFRFQFLKGGQKPGKEEK